MAGKNVGKLLKEGGVIVALVSKDKYSEAENLIAKESVAIQKTCYVSLNKPYNTLVAAFTKSGIDVKKMVFVDSASSGFGEPKDGLKVVQISSPKALTELNIAINKIIDGEKIKQLVFDSLSTLLVYEQASTVIKFSHSVISKLRSAGVNAVFLALKEDVQNELIKDLSMFVDKVAEI